MHWGLLWLSLNVAVAQQTTSPNATNMASPSTTVSSAKPLSDAEVGIPPAAQAAASTNVPTDVIIADFGTVEFPSSMTPDQIQEVLKRKFPGRTFQILNKSSTNDHIPLPPDGFILDAPKRTPPPSGVGASIEKSTHEIYSENKGAVVLLLGYDAHGTPQSLGSGFYFETNKIASNFHVVEGASKIVYRVIGSKDFHEVKRVECESKALDLAVLDVAEGRAPVNIASVEEAKVGDKVVAIGNPRGLEGSVSEGIVSAIRGNDDVKVLQITAPISPGSSGGPLFLANGEVIGVTTATLQDSQSLNFAIPAILLSRLRGKGGQWEPVVAKDMPEPEKGSAGISLVSPEFESVYGDIQFSLMNNNKRAIENVVYLLVFKDKQTGNFVNFITRTSQDVIPPGLAKRYNVHDESLRGFLFRERYPYNLGDGYLTTLVDVELRLLTYDFVPDSNDAGVLDLLQH